jgi:hypothetical protein
MAHELHTLITALLPPTCAVRLTKVTLEKTSVWLQLTATAPTAACPRCAVPASFMHSRYQRHPADLPWGTHAVCIHLTVRKFVCRNATCTRRIFTERLPDLLAPYARKTRRPIAALRAIGIALGGNAGARLAARLWVPASAATLLRLVRGDPIPPTPALQVDGIRRGAPQAVQVVDRFHLVHNPRETVEAFLITQRPALQAAAVRTAQALTSSAAPVPVTLMYGGKRQCSPIRQRQREAEQQRRHAPWVACYETIHALYAQGTGITTIARQLGISRPTVYAYLRRATPPAPRSPHRSGQVLRPYLPYLIRRWREGVTDSMLLWREIQRQGYTHSARTVCRFITRLRRAAEASQAPEAHTSPYTRPQGPSARAVSFAMVCPGAKRSLAAQTYVDQLCQVDTGMARAHVLIQAFLTMVRERRGERARGLDGRGHRQRDCDIGTRCAWASG